MKTISLAGAVLCVTLVGVGQLRADLIPIVWDGDSDGDGDGTSWSDPYNWDLNRVPSSDYAVTIDLWEEDPVIVISSNSAFGSLDCHEHLHITGGNFYVWGDGTVYADVEFLGGQIVGNNNTTSLMVNGLFTWHCSSTISLVSVTVVAAGGVELSGPGWKQIYSATFLISGPGTVADGGIANAGTFRLAPSGNLHVTTSGVQFTGSTVQNEGTLEIEGGKSATFTAPLTNSGTVRVGAGGSLTVAGTYSTGTGTIDLLDTALMTTTDNLSLNDTASVTGSGTLRLQSWGYLNGTHDIDANLELLAGGRIYIYNNMETTVGGSFTTADAGTSISGGTGGKLNLNGPVTLNGGYFGTITTITTGEVTIAGDTSFSGCLFENHGTVNWTDGDMGVSNGAIFRIAGGLVEPGPMFYVSANGHTFYPGSYGGGLDNQGTTVVDAATVTLAAASQNSGTLRVTDGSSLTIGGHSSSGTIDLLGAALMTTTGDLSLNGAASVTGSGTLRLQSWGYLNGTHHIGANLELLAGGRIYIYNDMETTVDGSFTTADAGASISGGTGGKLNLNGPVTLNGGNFSTITTITTGGVTIAGNTSFSGCLFEIHSLLDWYNGTISLSNGAILRIMPQATLNAHANTSMQSGSYGGALDNQGKVLSQPPGGSVTISANLLGPGQIEVKSGTLAIYDGSISGNITIDEGAVLEARPWNTGMSVGGNANITGSGTFRLNGTTASLIFTGTHVIDVPVEHQGNLSVNEGTVTFNDPYLHQGGWLGGGNGARAILNGDLTWAGAHLGGDSGFTIVLNGNTTAHFPGLPTDYCWLFGTLENHGVFTQTGWLRICESSQFVNWGVHNLYGKVTCCVYSCGSYTNFGLFFLGNENNDLLTSNSGTVEIGPGATLSVSAYTQNSGSTVVEDGGTLQAPGGVAVLAGTFGGSGTIVGSVDNISGVVAPGESPGTLTITGNYTQSAGGTLGVEVGGYAAGTEFDRLSVSGTATLGGTLDARLIDGFEPGSPADEFQFLSAGSRVGTFTAVTPCNDVVTYTASAASVSFNHELPQADAGPDQSVPEGTLVTLDGSGSSVHCGTATYEWTQLTGTPVTLDLTDPARPTFTPDIPCGCEVLTFQLVVSDDMTSSDPDTVDVSVPNVNYPPVAPNGEAGYAKNRYLSLVPENEGCQSAIRVLLADLPPEFEYAEGRVMWVGEPTDVSELAGTPGPTPPTFKLASLQCAPFYADWTQYGVVHVTGVEIVPQGVYELQAIQATCLVDVEANYSDPLPVSASDWGDTVGGDNAAAPQGTVDFVDISSVVDKFKNLPTAPSKSRVDVAPDLPDKIIDFTDIPSIVDAFKGRPYPYAGPPVDDPCP